MDLEYKFSDVSAFFEQGEWEIEKKMIDVGADSVEYAKEHGNYRDVTGKLRNSNDYDVDREGLTLMNKCEYASDVEARGYDVLGSASLYAEKRLKKEVL